MSQVNLEGREIANERLVLDSGAIYFLGPNLTLRNCALVLKVSARSLIIPQADFIDCTIDIPKELKNFRWEHASLKGCRFTGRMSGNDFGRWPWSEKAYGSIEGCDLTAAHLDACRFLGCDASTMRFPSWPYFTLLDPVRRYRELRAAAWPGDIGSIVVESFAEWPASSMAITYSALELAKRRGTTPEAIRAVLEELDGVKY
ncbi:hypothetical protein [Hyalangium rubrum]|uniref:Pentapeptide repeat-containing protein n=1 Tax=Hyalangium rubrum TaxID=3103134 RepID=A0ABU5HDB3_9BACT|nr:hypothetical protein [Hyalangium sp. s54d21]MDY7230095.1 hypothetical protein [Hyalangium sp. s54d21]